MNERIRELAIQSMVTVGDYSYCQTIIDPQKFAELIVNDILDITPYFARRTIREKYGLEPRKDPLSDYGDLFTLKEWNKMQEYGSIIDSDGSGYWATETHEYREYGCFEKRPEWATHVIWFNK